MTGRKTVAPAGVGAAIFACWVRPRLMRWGATDAEVTEAYAGAEFVPDGERPATTAVTIDAAPQRVWPWLVQMGWDHILAVWIMQVRMLAVLKRNVERAEARAAPALAPMAAKRR